MVDIAIPVRAAAVPRRALVAVVGAVVLWSASSLFVRAGHANVLVFTTWRLWFALPPLAAVIALRTRRGESVQMRGEGIGRLRWSLIVLGAGAFFASGAVTAFAALSRTRLLDVTLIGSLQPVVIVAVAVAFLGERADPTHALRALVALTGTVLVATAASGHGSWSLAGDVFAVVSLFLNAGWFLYGRVLRDRYAVDPFAFMLGVLSAAALLLTPIAYVSAHGLDLPRAAVGYAALTMLSGTTAHVLVVWAHRFVPASTSAPLLLAQPPIVGVAAWVCFGEVPGPLEVVGSAVVVGALWGMVRSPALEHVEESSPDPVTPV